MGLEVLLRNIYARLNSNGNTYNKSLERLEKMIEMGFKEGFTITMKSLEELLTTLKK
jgi:6-phosphogluconate dehydrogenase